MGLVWVGWVAARPDLDVFPNSIIVSNLSNVLHCAVCGVCQSIAMCGVCATLSVMMTDLLVFAFVDGPSKQYFNS